MIDKEIPLCHEIKTSEIVKILTLNRCLQPNSKHKVQHWYRGTILPLLNNPSPDKINPTRLYRSLDEIIEIEPKIQFHIYQKIRELGLDDFDLCLYDLTTSYLDGNKCTIGKYGLSTDHRPDKKQVLLALAITKNGYPFY